MSDTRQFPIQCEYGKARSFIPWWLAEIAYENYSARYGTRQSLERLAQRGGFGRDELVALLRKERCIYASDDKPNLSMAPLTLQEESDATSKRER